MAKAAFLGSAFIAIMAVLLMLLVNQTPVVKNAPLGEGTIVAFGDSLVEGVGSAQGGGFVSMLEKKLGRSIINLGVPGNTTADGLARLQSVRDIKPRAVIVLLGGNDTLRRVPKEETFTNLERIVRTLQSDGAMVILLGVRGGVLNDPYKAEFEALAKRTQALYIENVLAGLLGRGEYMFDAIHPNDAGYSIIADRVYEELTPYLTK
jgi:lysophospholipase L1-like esterase